MTPVRAAMAGGHLPGRDTGQPPAHRRWDFPAGLRAAAGGDAWAAANTASVTEVHPEVSFATLAGAVLPHPKKYWAGMVLRRCSPAAITVPDERGLLGAYAAVDDVDDATAAA
jgi:hypothetical protein